MKGKHEEELTGETGDSSGQNFSCGIMCPMNKTNFEDTQPTMTPLNSEEQENQKDLQPEIIAPEQTGLESNLDKTMATQVGQKAEQDAPDIRGTDETMPFQTDFVEEDGVREHNNIDEKTMPTPLPSSAVRGTPPDAGIGPVSQSVPLPKREAAPKSRPKTTSTGKRGGISWIMFPILGLLALMLIAFTSGVGGYFSGISLRKSAEATQVSQVIQEQYQLGLQDMGQGQYSRARQRFEYVIRLDPNYPGVTEKLSEVLLELSTTATPTLLPTPTVTPTPDLRGSQVLYDQSQQYILNKDWKNAIDTLLVLRKADPAYRPVDVDGMLFLTLRNQGGDKILKEADLEGGIYDLTLANKFGPLDSEAQALLNWSGMYITGASFWGIDWEQAVQYFSQVAPQLPNLRDGSGMTATERLRIAYFEYGNTLARQGHFCRAVEMYQLSLAIAPDPKVEEAGNLAVKGCSQGGVPDTGTTPKPGKKPKNTPIP